MTAAPPHAGSFPATPWTLVGRAARPDTPVPMPPRAPVESPGRRSLGELVELYRGPLLGYLRRRHGLAGEAAEEALAAFVADRVVAGRLAARADRGRGRFRTLLLVALDRQVIDGLRREGRRGRGRTNSAVPPDSLPCPDAARAQAAAEREWARRVLDRALAQAAGACHARGRSDVWLVLEQRLILPALDGLAPADAAALGRRLGGLSPTAVSNLLVTGKRLLARHLRATVAEYARPGEVDDEVRALWRAFAAGSPASPASPASKPPAGIEPATVALQKRCSAS